MLHRSSLALMGLVACSTPPPEPGGGELPEPSQAKSAPARDAAAPRSRDDAVPTSAEAEPAAEDGEEPTTATTPAEDAPDTYLLGVVGQSGRLSCPDGHTRQWLDVQTTVGSVPIGGVSEAEAKALMGRPVVAHGRVGGASPRPESSVSPCPPAQMRSDWVETPRGIRIVRGGRPGIGHFEVAEIRPITEITAKLDGDRLTVELGNPLPVPLEYIRLTLHYEGCFGKPGSHAATPKVAPVDPGASRSVSWPAYHVDGDRTYAASSVELRATAPGTIFDLDMPVGVLGAAVKCPRDDGRKRPIAAP